MQVNLLQCFQAPSILTNTTPWAKLGKHKYFICHSRVLVTQTFTLQNLVTLKTSSFRSFSKVCSIIWLDKLIQAYSQISRFNEI